MQNRKLVLTFLVIIPILFGAVLTPSRYSTSSDMFGNKSDSPDMVDTMTKDSSAHDAFTIAQDTQEGILNPNNMTQRGYQTTDILRARTDSGRNAKQNITIDESNDWKVSKSEIQVENLRKLYAQNGTFNDEYSPWINSTYDPSGGDQTQFAIWNETEGYVTCINYGEYTDKPIQDDTYTYHQYTEISWTQTITNSPATNNFSLSFDYKYVSGPTDNPDPYDFTGDIGIIIRIHTLIPWFVSVATGDLRDVWYSVSDFPVDLTGLPTSFDVSIGLYVAGADILLTEGGDYDDDGFPDGLANAEKVEINLDNIEFKSRTLLPYEDVDLTFVVEGITDSITGPTGGIGTSAITNPALWAVDPLEVEITANSTVTFDYAVTTYYQRYVNSSWTTDLSEYGVSYSIDAGQSADLELYTYVTTSSEYENLTLEIEFPSDWENTTIWDPLQNDITGLCTITSGSIFVPNSLFDRVGWWKVTHQSSNYAKAVSVQVYDTGMWTSSSLFRPGNLTRTQVELGTASQTPSSGSSVNVEWIMPNGTLWSTDSISNIVSGIANSSSLSFGGMNTSAGLWEVQVFWNNGTELAYDVDTFDLYHQASASAQYPSVETDYGNVIANQIILTDTDNGEYLLDDSVSVSANWSSSTIDFAPNFAKNWWQADFDTSLLENGLFAVIVDISRPYFDPISVQFTVKSTFETSLTITDPVSGSATNDLFDAFTVQLTYELWNGTGIEGAVPSLSHTGPQNGIEWGSFIDNDDGLYSLDVISNISTTYEITITLSKPYHYNASDSFTLSINEIGTEFILVNGTADVVQYGDVYRLVVEYRNSTAHGLIDANLQVVTITPSTGLTNGSFTHITGGFYEITFTPSITGTYAIVISAELFNHETQYVTFTLTGVVIPTTLTSVPSSASISVNETFILQLQFEDEISNPIDSATIELIDLPSRFSVSSATPAGSGLYNITISSSEIGLYNLLFRATATNYQSSIVGFTASVTEVPTELISVNGTADVVQFGDSYRLVVEYRNSTGYSLTGANLQVASITPSTGLTNGSFMHITGGFYEVTFTPSITGTYAIVISAELINHETQYVTFTLTGVVIPTVLTALPSSVSIAVNDTFILQLQFEDESSNPIDGATIELIDLPSGISVSAVTPVVGGLYNITIRSSEIDIYNLLFRASATNYQSSIVGFTVSITALPTEVEILNAGTIPVESGLNEVFTVQLSYELLNGTGVPGALALFVFSGPAEGLLWSNFSDNDNGLYSIDIICNVSATYGITITMSKPYYYNTTDSFTLIIGPTGSNLDLLNGTADVVLFNDSYRLVVEYSNSTGHGLPEADVLVVTVTPETGLVHTLFSHIADGYYEIALTPSAAGTFSIVICANITNHETQYTTFTLTASGIPTILTSIPSEYTVAINQTYPMQLRFRDESGNPIDNANITLLNPPVGLSASDAIFAGDGYYNITLESSTIQTFDLLFRATAINYQSSSAGFTFVVTEIQTNLNFVDGISSTVAEFAESFDLVVYYNTSDTNEAVQGADITVVPAVAELDIQVTEYPGYYIVTIRGNGIGSWALSIVANRTDYRIASKSFFIEVEEIDTTVEGSSPLETLLIGRPYDFTFSYIFESNSSNIGGATVIPTGSASDWVTYLQLGSGQYSVSLTPQELGEHSVLLTFEKVGFESRSFRLTFEVGRVPIVVEVLQGLSGPENSESVVNVQVTEADTGNPVTGVEVSCYMYDPQGVRIYTTSLIETATTGVYSGSIPMPVAEGEYHLEITCDAADYVMNANFESDLAPERNIATMLIVTTTRYYPIIFVFAALGFGLVYRRRARKNRIRENKATLAIKRRFDDIRSLMGVIVLHKESGLPIYSKILRDGLEETVISAFITAITSFRGEFDIETSSEEWGLIPISDIVRVISTDKLVCAFITTGNPSPEQRERMIQFAKTVGFIFDDTMSEVPIVVLDHHTTQQFNSLFEDLLDGQLLRTYKLDEVKKFPTHSCANERIAKKSGEEFKLEELASEIASCGLEEGRVYKAIMDALENQFLVTTDDSPFATELLRAPDTVLEEG